MSWASVMRSQMCWVGVVVGLGGVPLPCDGNLDEDEDDEDDEDDDV
jgi:hypothetical protein